MNYVNRIVRKEEMVCHLPALFAYIEENELGESVLHSAFDSKDGCWGKIVENIKLPCEASVDDKIILEQGSTHSYNTIMEVYYNYYSVLNDCFIKFIDNGIGKVKVTIDKDKTQDLVPKYVYLATVKSLYDEYEKASRQCAYYEIREPIDGPDAYMCCLCEEYQRKGGDKMRDFLGGLISVAEDRATEYLSYADSDNPLCITFPIQLTASVNDFGIITPDIKEWIAGWTYEVGDEVYYEGNVYKCTKENSGQYNASTEQIEFPTDSFEMQAKTTLGDTHSITGAEDSSLQTLRRYENYLNEYDEYETPEKGEDWLYFYRIGTLANIETTNDDFGNIKRYKYNDKGDEEAIDWANDPSKFPSGTVTDLLAYGDFLYNIEAKEGQITFTYYIGVHLIAEYVGNEQDENGKYKHYFTNFQPDLSESTQRHIVTYTETHTYDEDSDLATLIAGGNFSNYINGYYDRGGKGYDSDNVAYLFTKYEFNTFNNISNYDKQVVNDTITIDSQQADFTSSMESEYDLMTTNEYRKEYHLGISYQPKEDVDVNITRGTTTAFEKFIKFSEVKTLEAMENYSNGSFFNMINDS